ncbi:MAG: winged helix-turn-helix domain-containing protein [Gammaproteobacteria bacterium]
MSWHPRRLTAAQLEERRLTAGRLLRAGRLSQAAIARELAVTPAAVCRWAQQLQTARWGLSPLRRRPKPGRPPRLTPTQWAWLLEYLLQGARAAGFDTERWTLPRIALVVWRAFGVKIHPTSLSRGLRARGWSVHRPAPRAQERNAARIAQWRAHEWPRIKRGHGAQGGGWSAGTRRGTPFGRASGPPGPRAASSRRSSG